jgi:hypothetical protein
LASAVCGIPQVDVFTSSTNGTELKDNATDRFHTIGWYSHNHTCCHAQPTRIRKNVIQLPKKLQLINTWLEVQDPLASTSNETKVKRFCKHRLVNTDSVPRLVGAQREAETCCLYNDERSRDADRECVASSGLKNWPTAMTAEGGGIPETGCNMPINKFTTRQVHQFSHVLSKNHISPADL